MAATRCTDCGAEVSLGAARCWLCRNKGATTTPSTPSGRGQDDDQIVGSAVWLILIVILSVVLGLFPHYWFGIFFAFIAIPVWSFAFAGKGIGHSLKFAIAIAFILLLPLAIFIWLFATCVADLKFGR